MCPLYGNSSPYSHVSTGRVRSEIQFHCESGVVVAQKGGIRLSVPLVRRKELQRHVGACRHEPERESPRLSGLKPPKIDLAPRLDLHRGNGLPADCHLQELLSRRVGLQINHPGEFAGQRVCRNGHRHLHRMAGAKSGWREINHGAGTGGTHAEQTHRPFKRVFYCKHHFMPLPGRKLAQADGRRRDGQFLGEDCRRH